MAEIFIIDDDLNHRFLVKTRLESMGHTITEVEDGPTGIELLAEKKPDLIILDIMMPHLDGISLCRAVKKNKDTREIPIIILTATGQDAVRKKCLEAGADEFLTKPWNSDALAATVKQLLNQENK